MATHHPQLLTLPFRPRGSSAQTMSSASSSPQPLPQIQPQSQPQPQAPRPFQPQPPFPSHREQSAAPGMMRYVKTTVSKSEIARRKRDNLCTYCAAPNHTRAGCVTGRLMRKVNARNLDARLVRQKCPLCGDPYSDQHNKQTCPGRAQEESKFKAKRHGQGCGQGHGQSHGQSRGHARRDRHVMRVYTSATDVQYVVRGREEYRVRRGEQRGEVQAADQREWRQYLAHKNQPAVLATPKTLIGASMSMSLSSDERWHQLVRGQAIATTDALDYGDDDLPQPQRLRHAKHHHTNKTASATDTREMHLLDTPPREVVWAGYEGIPVAKTDVDLIDLV